ncbi:MAG: AmmeMemoRadiSam system radical SAM enzyme [Candidatus Latescibacteria bacterium]|nr:AmmeMemoRadiSam system radical SAM enzyme [Candidatus Latescibacterota bacterium]
MKIKTNHIIILFLLLGQIIFAENNPPAQREAMFSTKLKDNRVICELCPKNCVIASGKRGFCRNRENQNGTLVSVVYNKPCSYGREPIEKAPFYHFLPGATRITLATAGCNQSCKYCQNWQISQASVEDLQNIYLTPEQVIQDAQQEKIPIICFTYSEPIVFYEYMYDIAVLAKKAGIKTAVVSGGFINPEPLQELCKVVDAIKIDLKGFDPSFYQDVCGSELEPVLQACKIIKNSGVHLEIVNLVVPTLNDDTSKIKAMCLWIKENLGDEIPVHFSRFFPQYKLQNLPPTPITRLEQAVTIAQKTGIKYVYIGNVPGHEYDNTYCPNCKKLLLKRQGYSIIENNMQDGKCKFCKTEIYGVFE